MHQNALGNCHRLIAGNVACRAGGKRRKQRPNTKALWHGNALQGKVIPMNKANNNFREDAGSRQLPPWAECEVFCIHSYAGEVGPPCGWRGKLTEIQKRTERGILVCPCCGRATLLPIPAHRKAGADA